MNKDKLMYGLEEFKLKGLTLGYIAQDSFDWGGAKGEKTPIYAAQKKSYPIHNIVTKNAIIAPTFDLIQFNYENMVKVMGGSLKTNAEGVTVGWNAPKDLVEVSGEAEIDTDSGQRVTIPNADVSAYITGGLTLTDTSKIKIELGIMEPGDGLDPYTIEDIPTV